MKQKDHSYTSIFELNGIPKFSQALPLALQHVVATIVAIFLNIILPKEEKKKA
ncbi:MAG: hypothetical protein QM683_08745 [Lacrimispora sp.]